MMNVAALPHAAGMLLLNDTLSNSIVSIEQVQHNAETEPLPFQSGSIEAVFFLEVLEHLQKDPFFAILEMHRVLKLNGELEACSKCSGNVHQIEAAITLLQSCFIPASSTLFHSLA
jgi:ubiquinone/menaquinone biosynthesis C-methylase UbiE